MSGTELLFFLVVVPAVIVAVIWVLALLGGPKAQQRYRPGRAYEFTPVWFLANHRRGPASSTAASPQRAELTSAEREPRRAELTSAESEPSSRQPMAGTTGGASDRW